MADEPRRVHRLKREVTLPQDLTVFAQHGPCWKLGCRGVLVLEQARRYTRTSDVATYSCPVCKKRWLWRTGVIEVTNRGESGAL